MGTSLQYGPPGISVTCESPVDQESIDKLRPVHGYAPPSSDINSVHPEPIAFPPAQVLEIKPIPVAEQRIRLAPPPLPLKRRPAISIRGPRPVHLTPARTVHPLTGESSVLPTSDATRAEHAPKPTLSPTRPTVVSRPRAPPLPPRPSKEPPTESSMEKLLATSYSPVYSPPPAYSSPPPVPPALKNSGNPRAPPLPPRPSQQQLQSAGLLPSVEKIASALATNDISLPTINTSNIAVSKAPPLPPRPRASQKASPPHQPQPPLSDSNTCVNTPSSAQSSFTAFPTRYLPTSGDSFASPYPNSPPFPQSSTSYASSDAPWTPANYSYDSPPTPYVGGASAFQMPVPTIPLFYNPGPPKTHSFEISPPLGSSPPWGNMKDGIGGESSYIPY